MKHRLYPALLLSAASVAVSACWTQTTFAQQNAESEYGLPAQPLAQTLKQIATMSGTNILAAGRTVEGKRAPALTGRHTVVRALELVLLGSGLRARTTASGLVVEPDTAPATEDLDPNVVPSEIAIVVTGSRIRGAPIASPVIILSERSIRNAGQATLGEVVRSIPQSFGGGQQPGIGFNVPGSSGVNVGGGSSINLRGLGSDATLTLLNGHRLSYGGSRQSIDVSAIPLSAVDRIEIVPDGASAIYGSDAVAGVANIILKRDYQGLETRARLGASTDGGNFTQQYGALGGSTWHSGGFALAYEYNDNSQITSSQRNYARDATPGLTLFPAIESHNVLLTGHQALGGNITFSIDALYNRRSEFFVYPLDFGGDLAALHGERSGGSRSYAIAPSLEWVVSDRWKVGLAGTVAEDRTRFRDDNFVGTSLVYSTDGCYCNKERSIELSGNGSLTTLPGGDIKTALGAGYRKNETAFSAGSGNAQNFTRGQGSYYSYAEVSLPIVGPAMAVRGINRLELTGAVRYEQYPGIGDVATPKFGLVFAPDETFDFKASWGKSFRAPTLRQQFQPKAIILFQASAVGGAGYPNGSTVAVIEGGNSDLRPERATSWSATLAIHPPSMGGARVELSYFNTIYRDRVISPIDRTSQALSNPVYRDYVILNPPSAQVAALIAAAPSFINATGAPYVPASVVAIADDSNVNAGRQRIHGVDVLAGYRWELAGRESSIDLTANASYLKSDQQITPTLPVTTLAGNVFNPPHLRARGGASWRDGSFTLTANLSYIGSVIDNRATTSRRISAMTPVDLTARYQTTGSGFAGGLDVSLSVQNLFNEKPATISGIFYEAPYDSTNYSPVGRYVSLSIAKKW